MESFANRLQEYGICFPQLEEHSPIIKKEAPLIICELMRNLNNEIYPHFINELQDFCINDEAFQLLLSKTTLHKGTLKLMKQPSILLILLAIKELQPVIFAIVMKKLTEHILTDDLDVVHAILDNLSAVYNLHHDNNIASQLLEMIDIGNITIKIEILNFLPRIVAKEEIDKVAKHLIQLVKEDDTLQEHIMRNFLLYDLTKETASELTEFILRELIESPQYYGIFHLLFAFLMKYNADKLHILKKTYFTLDKVLCGNGIDKEMKLTVHKKVYQLAKKDPVFNSALIKYDIKESKTIDIYLFMLAYSAYNEDGQSLKNRLTAIYKSALMENFINNCCTKEIMNDLHQILLDLEVMLIEAHTESKNYGAIGEHLYRLHFSSKYCDTLKRNVMIYNIKSLLFKQPTIIIHMLQSLYSNAKLIKHTNNLIPFLALYLHLPIVNFKCLFDVICGNAVKSRYDIGEMQKFVDQLLAHCDVHGKKGIIAAISMAKHLAVTDESHYDRVKSLISSAYTKCKHYQDGLGLYYDELANTFVSRDIDEALLHWLNEDITTKFESYYIIFGNSNNELPIPVKVSYELNLQEELEESMSLNIGVLVQKPDMYVVILALPALFRLFRLLTSCIFDGDLSEIDALLGCGILTPNLDDFDYYVPEDLMKVTDCIFFMINWFRELVNAFILQGATQLRIKLLQRINHIIELEDKLCQCLAILEEHKFPKCNFYEELVKPTSMRLKQTKEDLDNTEISAISNKANTQSLNIEKYMRIIDIDLFGLLKYPVCSNELSASQMKSLTSGQFQFIIRNINSTLTDIINCDDSISKSSHGPTAIEFLKYCHQLMPFIKTYFKQVVQEIGIILERNDYCFDASEIFSLNCTNLKRTFDIVIEFYKTVFSWMGWHHKENNSLLKRILTLLCESKTNDSTNDESLSDALSYEVAEKFIDNISSFKNHCLLLSSAGNTLILIKNVRILVKLRRNKIDPIAVSIAKEFLDRQWFSSENKYEIGNAANKHIQVIISTYISDSNIKMLHRLVEILNNELKDKLTGNTSINLFRAINQSNIHILYKCICRTIVNKLNRECASKSKQEPVHVWRTIAGLLQNLMEISKKIKGIAVVKTFCRFSVDVINIFLNYGIPTLGKIFQKQPGDVHDILSLLLPTSIYLYRLSCQVTHKRNSTTRLVEVRISLHKLDKAVREMFAAHKHKDKIWLGVLSNVDTAGEPILSQNTLENQTSDDDTEEDINESGDELAYTNQQSSELFE